MHIRLVAYGIARDILGAREMQYEAHAGDTVADLKQRLITEYPAFSKLAGLAFAIGEEYVPDLRKLKADDEVIVLPPVSGG